MLKLKKIFTSNLYCAYKSTEKCECEWKILVCIRMNSSIYQINIQLGCLFLKKKLSA